MMRRHGNQDGNDSQPQMTLYRRAGHFLHECPSHTWPGLKQNLNKICNADKLYTNDVKVFHEFVDATENRDKMGKIASNFPKMTEHSVQYSRFVN